MMEAVDLRHAKEHLEELIERARRGEDVRISDPKLGTVRLTAVEATSSAKPKRRQLGLLEGKIPPPPADFFDPFSDEELKHWYGDDMRNICWIRTLSSGPSYSKESSRPRREASSRTSKV